MTKAKNQKGKIKVKFIKILFTGSGKAGKTSFSNLLMKNKFVDFHHSTKIVQAKHAVSVKKAVIVESNQTEDHNVVWLEMNDDSQMSHLRQILLSLDISSLQKTRELKASSSSQMPATYSNTDQGNKKQETIDYISYQNPNVLQRLHNWFQGPVKSENLEILKTLCQNSIESNMLKHAVNYHGEVLNIITLLDTGGQPEYIHLLPTVNIHPMVNFVIHDLSKNLEDQVLVEYSEDGKLAFKPYHLTYSNFDMIKFLMCSINDSLERFSSQVPQMITIPGRNKISYICCVGTHADRVGPHTIRNADRQITTMVKELQCKTAVWENENGGVLFPVDNTTSGSGDAEDPIANFIRNKIDEIAAEKDVYELPITWMLFELEIRQVCSKKGMAYISFRDCYSIAYQSNLIPSIEEVKSALIYHHLLGVLLYYPDVPGLCDYVIIDHQWLFDKISSIVCISFKPTANLLAAYNLKYNGILTMELIQELRWKEEIKEKYFIDLLVKMRIISPIQRKECEGTDYFIPYILPAYTFKSNRNDILSRYGCLQGEPLLIQFASNLLPRGLFCCLVVELLQHLPNGWDHAFDQTQACYNYSNLITFHLQNLYYLSLMDKLSYLEVQIRHRESDYYIQCPVHQTVMNILKNALQFVCEQLNYDRRRLQHGFICECANYDDKHLAIPTKNPPFNYASCKFDSFGLTTLKKGHIVWLQKVGM